MKYIKDKLCKISKDLENKSLEYNSTWLLNTSKELLELSRKLNFINKEPGIKNFWFLTYPHGSMLILKALNDKNEIIPCFYKRVIEDIKNYGRKYYLKEGIIKDNSNLLLGKELYLVEKKNILGKMLVEEPIKIVNEKQFDNFEIRSCITRLEAIEWWNKLSDLWFFPVKIVEIFPIPQKYNR